MSNPSLPNIKTALGNAAAAIHELLRQEAQGSNPPFVFFQETIDQEVLRLRGEGQLDLADALAQLRDL